MTVGTHAVKVFTDPLAGAWSAPIASNPYLTANMDGWTQGPFAPAWVWHADGSADGSVGLARLETYPVPRTPASAYRLRATVTLATRANITLALNYGLTAHDAWAGPVFSAPGACLAQSQWWVLAAGTYSLETTLAPGDVPPGLLFLGPTIYTWGDAAPTFSITTLELTQRLSPGVDLSCLVDSVSINHGRDDSGSQPEASSATVDISTTPADPLPLELDVGAVIEVSTTVGDGASSQRFVGRVTDLALAWDEAGEDTPDSGTGQIVAVGSLGDLGRRVVGDVPWPVELDGARVARVMAAAGITLDPLTSDPGVVQLLARDIDATPALDAARDAAVSAGGLVWQTRGGDLRYADSSHRRGTRVTLTMDACDLLVTPTWRRTIEGLVNEVSVSYGVAPDGGEQPTFADTAPTSVARWGRYGYSAATSLAALADAQAMGRLLLARNSAPVWVMAALPVDVEGLDADRTAALLDLELHSLITLTGLPSLGTAPTTAALWVEGWKETLSYGVHDLDLVVSGYCRTAPPPRWDDLAPEWTWANIAPPSLTWDDAACLGPPVYLGRWNDQPATLRWDQVPATTTWDTYA